MRLNDYYHDRGIQKYSGFFLSEHTASLNTEAMQSNRRIKGKEQMTEQVIFEVINHAILKNERISIQLNLRDIEGNFFENINGFLKGYNEDCLYINDIKIPFNQIRHVKEIETHSWFK